MPKGIPDNGTTGGAQTLYREGCAFNSLGAQRFTLSNVGRQLVGCSLKGEPFASER
jgi:hypothetical protein